MSSIFIADWVNDTGRKGLQGSVANHLVKPFSKRDNSPGGGYTTTSARTAKSSAGQLPMTISLYSAGTSSPSDLVKISSFTLLINPADMNLGSSQVYASQYARDGYVNSLWGADQSTITCNGSSAAFINRDGGLADTQFYSQGVSKRNSLAYANLMSFVSLIRNNGYRHLTEGGVYGKGVKNLKVNSDNPDFSETVKTKEDSEEKRKVSSLSYPAMPSQMIGESRSRVVHVMDTLSISYGGTTYLGSFNSFSLEDDAYSPFKFNYSFEFVVSGLLGDTQEGHLSSGNNAFSGIKKYIQGVDGLTNGPIGNLFSLDMTEVNKELLKLREKAAYDFQSELKRMADKGLIQLKDPQGIDAGGLQKVMTDIIPTVSQIYANNAASPLTNQTAKQISLWNPPVVTSALDGKHNRNSLHYEGLALDFRIRQAKKEIRLKIVGELAQALGPKGYWVLYHYIGTDDEHIHIEYNKARSSSKPTIKNDTKDL